ncbi:MAG TPA: hypothetical protein VHQ65_01280 [Thermoanaerobaculia bacterium]|nr:hypothetical protein [Thermoanaerobaculia bacterium]
MKLSALGLVLLAAALSLAAAAPAAAEERTELLAAVDPLLEPYPVPEYVLPIGLRAYGLLPAQLLTVGDRTFFIADDREHGVEPWVTDGTVEGTRRVFDLAPGEASSFPRFLGDVDGRVVFWAFGHTAQRVLMSTDGTESGTLVLSGIPSSEDVGPTLDDDWFQWIAPPEAPHLGGELLFTTSAGACELWATDGLTLRRLDRLEQGSCSTALVVSGGRVYYGTWNGTWRTTDGVGEPEPLPLPPCSLGPLQIRAAVAFAGGIALSTYCGGVRGVVAVQRRGSYRVLGEVAGRELEMLPDGGDLWLLHATGEVGFRVLRVRPAGDAEVVATVQDATLVEALGIAGGSLVVQAVEPEHQRPQVWTVSPDGEAAPLTTQPLYAEQHWVRRTPQGLVFLASPEALLGVDSHTYLWDVWTTGGSPETTRRVVTFSTPHRGPDGLLRGRIAPHLAVLDGGLILAADDGGGQQLRALRAPVLDAEECVAAPGVLCLGGGRFEVRVRYGNQHAEIGFLGDGEVRLGTADSGYFWFFRPTNLELLVKVLDGVGVNGYQWVFHGPMTDLDYWLQVSDAATGITRTYHRAPGGLCGGADVRAFSPGPPLAENAATSAAPWLAGRTADLTPAVGCEAQPDRVCLGGGRFGVVVTFRDHHNAPAVEQTAHGSAETEDSASFWFFRPDNVEVLVKVLDGTPVNGHHWIFVGAMTDLAFDVEVTDNATGVGWSWQHEQGSLCGTADTTAF